MSRQNPQHQPVMLDEVIEILDLESGQLVIDGTVGLGGHAFVIAQKIGETGRLICFDRDQSNLKIAKSTLESVRVKTEFMHSSYHLVDQVLKELNVEKVDRILLDLGISSFHIDSPDRGFAYRFDGPLDMRFDVTSGQTAAEKLVDISEADLISALREYGEVKEAHKIARKIKTAAKEDNLNTTFDLLNVIEANVHPKWRKKVTSQVFQAIRILVNNELGIVEIGLQKLWEALAVEGIIAILTFHSVEDRMVKNFFKDKLKACICPKNLLVCECPGKAEVMKLFKSVKTPPEEEILENPRARSAKLRAYKRLR